MCSLAPSGMNELAGPTLALNLFTRKEKSRSSWVDSDLSDEETKW